MKDLWRGAMKRKAVACTLAVACVLVAATACAAPTEGEGTNTAAPGPVVALVEIVAPSTIVAVGGSTTLKATAFDSSGNALSVHAVAWTSSSSGIARVTAAGTVEGVAAGTATITATVGGRSASVSISVRSIGAVTRVVVTPGRLHLLPFGNDTLRATAYDANGFIVPGRSVTWSISDNTIAKISATGIVTGFATGTVRVTALVDGQTGSGDVVVVSSFGPAVSQVHVSPGGWWGWETACAVTQSGTASCWGDNSFGQVGDGTKTNRQTPVAVAGSITFRTLRPGGMLTCGLTPEGAAYCWGSGALGDGTTTSRLTPTPVTGGHQFTQLVVGYDHACGLDGDGQVWCWGSNRAGQLGVGSATPSSAVPVMVLATVRFETLSTHYTHWMGDHSIMDRRSARYRSVARCGAGVRRCPTV